MYQNIMCYFTKKVLNKRFLPNRKNGWNPPVCTDERFRYVEVEKEIEYFYYEMITRRMSAEAAKETAENMLKKIENEYKLGSDQNLREWIYGGVDRIN